ncbi:glycerol-3-phosphate responsive antiterminator [Thalassorhabdus alkalitolerans]|uniref:Glycerol uptake operon antiterminator regulatory protein n=1 Tax=Thalassorhabdus alkalitolerans TaxID=2282697 RepID=A0ABW0YI78_9BACI
MAEKKKQSFTDMMKSPIIAAISSPKRLDEAMDSKCSIAFLMMGDVMSLPNYVKALQQAGMKVFVHLDFVEGVANDRSGVRYVARQAKPEGIISTKNQVIRYGKEEGMLTIQRFFLIDKSAIDKGIQMVESSRPDAVEILPGVIPKVINRLSEQTSLPLIAGGLIETLDEIQEALDAGAVAASCGSKKLWNSEV